MIPLQIGAKNLYNGVDMKISIKAWVKNYVVPRIDLVMTSLRHGNRASKCNL